MSSLGGFMVGRYWVWPIAGVALLGGCEQKASPPPSPAKPVVETWRYSKSVDEMSGKPIYLACLRSTNAARLSPPYGSVKGVICLQDHPRSTVAVLIRLDGEGQIVCPMSGACSIPVRFDDKDPNHIEAERPSDGATNVLLVSDRLSSSYFRVSMAQARTTRLELEFYRDGRQVLVFNTQGLDFTKTGWVSPD